MLTRIFKENKNLLTGGIKIKAIILRISTRRKKRMWYFWNLKEFKSTVLYTIFLILLQIVEMENLGISCDAE